MTMPPWMNHAPAPHQMMGPQLPPDPAGPGDVTDPAGQGNAQDVQIISAAAKGSPVIAAIARVIGIQV